MARLPVKPVVIRALFAKSGNICAYPGCTHELVNSKNKFVAQVCHIEAAAPRGERYNINQNDEQRRGFDNLLIMCFKHHVETDNVDEYSVKCLKEMKGKHEALHGRKVFKIDESVVFQIESEILRYWDGIEK